VQGRLQDPGPPVHEHFSQGGLAVKKTILSLLALLVLTSCASLPFGSPEPSGPQESAEMQAAGAQQPEQQQTSQYYDFKDILIPQEMSLKPDQSIIFHTPGVKAGVLFFEGRVEPVSLFNFFANNMPKDNWTLRSFFKYGRYMMVFEKPDRDCVLAIKDKRFNTLLQVWVTPRVKASGQSGVSEQILSE
jgi:hypothetical protein